jgi:nucleoid DNA-binding protein
MEPFTAKFARKILLPLSFVLLLAYLPHKGIAQQNPHPFSVDLNFGGGLIGNPDISTAFLPELGFSYMPGKFGVGFNAGLLSYKPAFDAQQYANGFEEYTSVSNAEDKWRSFFFGAGPRFEFGSRLPVTFRSSLDLTLSYNSPPDVSVNYHDPSGSIGDLNLQLSGYDAGEDYTKWSVAIRPEFQMQFSPGGSDRFSINVTTGIQHRLSKNEFTYSQRDLSEVQLVPNTREMFIQFESAPQIQQTAQPPQTNFFTTVGIKIKFGVSHTGLSKADAKKALGSAMNPDSNTNTDCDDTDECAKPGEMAPPANNTNTDCDDRDECPKPGEKAPPGVQVAPGQTRVILLGAMSPDGGPITMSDSEVSDWNGVLSSTQYYKLEPTSSVVSLSTMQISTNSQKAMESAPAQDYNSSRSNKPSSIADNTDPDMESDSTTAIAPAQDYNSSRSNKPSSIADNTDPDVDADSTKVAPAQDYNAARSNKPSSIADIGDLDSDGFPDILANASFSISKRSARTGRNQNSTNEENSDVEGLHFDLEIDPLDLDSDDDGLPAVESGVDPLDTDSDDDGLLDAIELGITYSISKRSARTGRNPASTGNEIQTNEGTSSSRSSDDQPLTEIFEWTYDLKTMTDDSFGDLTSDAKLVILFVKGNWHIDLQFDPDSDQDGYADLLQNSSFSISKRSARTGRN